MSLPWELQRPPALLTDRPLSVHQRVRKGALVLTVVGVVDALSAPALRAILDKALRRAGARRVVVDLLGVTLLAAAGLAALTQAAHQALHQNVQYQPLRVVVGHDWYEPLRPILTRELDQALTLCHSVSEALTI